MLITNNGKIIGRPRKPDAKKVLVSINKNVLKQAKHNSIDAGLNFSEYVEWALQQVQENKT